MNLTHASTLQREDCLPERSSQADSSAEIFGFKKRAYELVLVLLKASTDGGESLGREEL